MTYKAILPLIVLSAYKFRQKFVIFSFKVIFLRKEMFVGSLLQSGNKVGKVIVAKNGYPNSIVTLTWPN